jgi:hypothetical protein
MLNSPPSSLDEAELSACLSLWAGLRVRPSFLPRVAPYLFLLQWRPIPGGELKVAAAGLLKEHAPDDTPCHLAERVVEHLEQSGFDVDEEGEALRRRLPVLLQSRVLSSSWEHWPSSSRPSRCGEGCSPWVVRLKRCLQSSHPSHSSNSALERPILDHKEDCAPRRAGIDARSELVEPRPDPSGRASPLSPVWLGRPGRASRSLAASAPDLRVCVVRYSGRQPSSRCDLARSATSKP